MKYSRHRLCKSKRSNSKSSKRSNSSKRSKNVRHRIKRNMRSKRSIKRNISRSNRSKYKVNRKSRRRRMHGGAEAEAEARLNIIKTFITTNQLGINISISTVSGSGDNQNFIRIEIKFRPSQKSRLYQILSPLYEDGKSASFTIATVKVPANANTNTIDYISYIIIQFITALDNTKIKKKHY